MSRAVTSAIDAEAMLHFKADGTCAVHHRKSMLLCRQNQDCAAKNFAVDTELGVTCTHLGYTTVLEWEFPVAVWYLLWEQAKKDHVTDCQWIEWVGGMSKHVWCVLT